MTPLAREFLDAHPPPQGAAAGEWKHWTDAGRAFLAARFPEQDVGTLIRARSELADRMLQDLWTHCRLDGVPELALLAVGGYGRAELHPHSDIDVLALRRGRADPEALRPLFQTLWDGGLKLAQSVRTVAQCRQDARRDITLMTSWMEMRPLCGEPELARELEDALMSRPGLFRTSLWSPEKFFQGKVDEQQARHRKFGGDAYRLEPNIKEGPGGLRDIQTIHWILKRRQDVRNLADFCDPQELELLREGQEFLWRVRFALHHLSGQPEERLLFDYQHETARLLGYSGNAVNDVIEAFMQDYYRMAGAIDRLADVLQQQYRELLQPARRRPPKPLNAYFQIADGYLETVDDQVFARHPQGLLELFLLLQQNPEIEGVRARTIRAVRAHLHRIDDGFRAQLAPRTLFMEILRQPLHVARELRRMHRYGVLPAYWPAFAAVVGKMQYDLFHVHPVDEHTLQVLTELRHITKPKQPSENPLFHELFLQFPKPELLYLGALFHDIGKGRGGDHSILGAADAHAFCLAHHLSAYDAGIVRWLVEHHLLMSMTAQKRDIGDPDVVRDFAAVVGNGVRLRGLYLLTVADLRGTNPALWTPWREALLHQLYVAADRQLQRGLDRPADAARQVRDLRASALAQFEPHEAAACERFWDSMPDGDLLHYTDDELAWQTAAVIRGADAPAQAFVRHKGAHHCTEVLIIQDSRARLFVPVTAALARLGADVLYARVVETREQRILLTFLITDAGGQPISEGFALEEIEAALQAVLENPAAFDRPVLQRPKRHARHFDIPTRIEFVQRNDPPETQLQLTAASYPGLLWTVSRALDEARVQIHQARIMTLGAQAQDVFTITDAASRPISDPGEQARIAGVLHEHIERQQASGRPPPAAVSESCNMEAPD